MSPIFIEQFMAPEAPENSSGQLIKSFFVVVTCYLLFMMSLAVVCGLFFPDAFMAMGEEEERFLELLENHAAELFPRGRFLPIVIMMTGLSFSLGWLVVKLASFARMSHAVFLVLIVGVTLFQIVLKIVPEVQWLFIALTAACPIGMIAGGRWSLPLSDDNYYDGDDQQGDFDDGNFDGHRDDE